MIYETDKDRERQDIAAWLLEYDGFEVTQSRTTAPWDFALKWRGEPYALVEYKFRKKQYDPYKIDCEKIDNLITMSADWGVKPILMVEWDGIGGRWVWNAHKDVPRGTLQRLNRPGEAVDEVYCIPISEFKIL